MASRTKLEQAVSEKASSLNDAQRELVLSQFSIYKRNKARIAEIETKMKILESKQIMTSDEMRFKQSERQSLAYEHSQLTTANSRISAELFEQLGDRR